MSDEDDLTQEEAQAMTEMRDDAKPAPVAPATTEAAPESTAEPSPEAKADKPPEGFVPHAAMHEERARRKELERQVAEMAEWRRQMEAALKPKPADPAPPPEIPDPVTDFAGYQKWVRDETARRDAEIRALRDERAREVADREMFGRVQQAEASFAAANPDYMKAADYLRQSRAQELALFGFDAAQVQQIIAQETRSLVQTAFARGVNPAEVAYAHAKMRGWGASAPAAAPAAPAAPDAAAQVTALAKAATATRNMASAPGGDGAGVPTLAQLAEMDEDDYFALDEKTRAKILAG